MYNSDDVDALARSLEQRYEFPRRGAIACAREALKRTLGGKAPEVFPLDPCRLVACQWADHIAIRSGAQPRPMK